MAENIGVLMIFFVLIIIVIVFIMAFFQGSIAEQVSEFKTRNAVQLAAKIALLPELQCRKNNVQEEHCFDKLRADAAKLMLQDASSEDYYFRILGYSTIRIRSIYPPESDEIIYDKQAPEFTNNDTFSIPVSIFDPRMDIYKYGVLEVNVYG